MLRTSETESTIIPINTDPDCPLVSTTIIHVRSVYPTSSIPNLSRRLTTGITFPLRLITPFTYAGILGTGVIGIIPIISLILRIPIPYSSPPKENVKYFPSRLTIDLTT